MYNQIMNEFLLDPNFAYLVLVLGLLLGAMAIFTPGTGIPEAGAVILLLLAGWEVYNLPVNAWALLVLLLAAVFYVLAFRQSRPQLYLGLSILALVIGSAFLFRGETPFQPAVNPLLALVASALSSSFIWIGGRKALEARRLAPAHSLEGLIGAVGEAKSDIQDEGSVQVAGELWSARSNQPIASGAQVRVLGREGFILHVEAIVK